MYHKIFSDIVGEAIRSAFSSLAESYSNDDLRGLGGHSFEDYVDSYEGLPDYIDGEEYSTDGLEAYIDEEPAGYTDDGSPKDYNGMIMRPFMVDPLEEDIEQDIYYQGTPLPIPEAVSLFTKPWQGKLLPTGKVE